MTDTDNPPGTDKKDPGKVCPFLGLQDDSQTSLYFPSGLNLCYHSRPLASPSLHHQQAFCLKGKQHTVCPVFTRTTLEPLPPEITLSSKKQPLLGGPIEKRVLVPVLVGLVVLILVGIGIALIFANQGGKVAAPAGNTASSVQLPPTAAATDTLADTDIPITPNIIAPPTLTGETPSATFTVTPTLPPVVVVTPVPFRTAVPCGRPYGWVAYTVQPGDSLYRLSLLYGVTIADLQQANCLGSSTVLHTGQILYVPPGGQLFPSPTFPLFLTPSDTPVVSPTSSLPSDTPTEIPTSTDVPSDTPSV